MKIEVRQSRQDGLWYVVAHLSSGLAHDTFFTQAEALQFAASFYGATTIQVMAAA